MAWTLMQDKANIDDSGAESTTFATTFDLQVTAGDLIVVTVCWGRAGVTSCADSAGNAYSACGPVHSDVTGDQHQQTFYAVATAGGFITVTATFDALKNFLRMGIAEFSGNSDTPFDQVAGQQTAPGTGVDAVSSGPITPSVAGALVYGFAQIGSHIDPGAGLLSPGTGFSATEGDDPTPDIFMGEWLEQSSPAAISATFTSSTAERVIASVVSFKPDIPAEPTGLPRSYRTSVPPNVRLG